MRGKEIVRNSAGRTRPLLMGACLLAVLTVAAVLLWRDVFVVRNVIVEGTLSAADEEIIREAQVDVGGSIYAVEPEKLKMNLENSGRFSMDGVEIRYPSTLILRVRERTRDAMVLNGGKILVLDSDGYVIEVCSAVPENSGVYVTGLEGTSYRIGSRISAPEEKLSAMKAATEAIRTQGAAMYISELNVDDPLNLWITTRTGIRVELGDEQNMDGKILWLRSAVADLESRGDVKGTLDVSSGTKADYQP